MSESIQCGDSTVHIHRKPFRRSISLSVWPSGKVVVRVGKATSHRVIRQFIENQDSWLQKQLLKSREVKEKFPAKKFQDGELYPYLGRNFLLKILPADTAFVTFLGEELLFHQPESMSDIQAFDRLKTTYKDASKKVLQKRVGLYSQKMQLFPKSLSFRAQKTVWGSCSGDDRISLNWKLVVAPLWVVDYVVIHELAHITHKNHSPRFWALVEAFTPNRHLAKDWLRDQAFLSDFLNKVPELHP